MQNTVPAFFQQTSSCPFFIAGPCAVESYDMLDEITGYLVSKNISVIRAGAFKPRTSPDSFQGLGIEALAMCRKIRKKYAVKIVSEIVDLKYLTAMCEAVDILQVGSRNMFHYELLKELGRTRLPVILKRGLCATVYEYIQAAQYILRGGNYNLIFCERGIRSYDRCTRNVLDLSAVAILKKEADFPVLVDISHSLGRKDIAVPMSRAALAAGADGIMVEVHNHPEKALSDSEQQMSFSEFTLYYEALCNAPSVG